MDVSHEDIQAALGSRYHLLRQLGRGGTALVFLATDVKHGRRVALKILRPELADGLTVRRFEREISLVGRLVHPNILAMLDSGQAEGIPYFVMPYVSGESLAVRLSREGRLNAAEAIRLACEVADALDYANAAGVVHRDIKPGNLLLIGQHAVVTDFGVGWSMRLIPDPNRTTGPGIVVGTMAYMSPEQAAGERQLDGRSDEYSLAVTFHELLTGTPPFSGTNPRAVMAERFKNPPPPLRQVRTDVSEALERAVLRALAFEANERFPTVGEFGAALRAGVESPEPTPNREAVPRRLAAEPLKDRQPSIAVLPFLSLTSQHDDEYLAYGLAEEITNALGQLRSLRVVARTSLLQLDRDMWAIPALGERLGATALLDGSIQRVADRVRLVARLVSTSDGHQLWTKQFVREGTDVFALQEELAQAVVSALEVDLLGQTGRALVGSTTTVAAARDLYFRGRFAWNKRTEPQMEQSIRLFEAALELDPEFAAAHAALANAYLTLCVYGVRGPQGVMPLARRAAERALAINPAAADSHVAMAEVLAVYDWDWSAAETEFRRALSIEPTHAIAHHSYAVNVLAPVGRHEDAMRHANRAAELDPLSPVFSASVGIVLFAARRYADCARQYERTLDLEPNFGLAYFFMGQALVQLGALDRAIGSFERAIELSGRRLEIVSALAHVRGLAGQPEHARELLGELENAMAARYVSPYLIAQAHIGLGHEEDALTWLERALDERAAELAWIGVREVWYALSKTPRYSAVSNAVQSGTVRAQRINGS